MDRYQLRMVLAILVTTGNIGEDEALAIATHLNNLSGNFWPMDLDGARALLKGWEFSKPQPAPAENLLEDDSP